MRHKAAAQRLTIEKWGRLFWNLWLLAALGFIIAAGFAAAVDYFPADRTP